MNYNHSCPFAETRQIQVQSIKVLTVATSIKIKIGLFRGLFLFFVFFLFLVVFIKGYQLLL